MIIARSPLRISLGGGGTDLPSYYRGHGGFLLSAAIDKYVYVSITKPFKEGYNLKYSKYEQVNSLEEIKHPIIKECLKILPHKNIEIVSMADLPSGTGLGSSGSFTTALIKALYTNLKMNINYNDLAELACDIEINKLNEPVGKQDQYIASYGGINSFTFNKDNSVVVEPLKISKKTKCKLEDNLLLFFTGYERSASKILADQNIKSQKKDQLMLDNLHKIKKLGIESKKALESGEIKVFGEIMNEHWEFKKNRTGSISNSKINDLYDLAMTNGALGGKLVGAGGGGFLMFISNDPSKLRDCFTKVGMQEVEFKFDFEGTKILINN